MARSVAASFVHRLIWGIVRLDGAAASEDLLQDLTREIRQAASIGETASCVSGGAVLAQADLVPVGAAESGSAPRIAKTDDTVFASDLRLYTDTPDQEPPGESDVLETLACGDPDAIASLNGDFVCAAWFPATGRLRLCRDIVGARPLFYVHRPGEFLAFSSLSVPLVEAGLASRTPNARTTLVLQSWNFDSGTETMLQEVKRVPAAHLLEIDPAGLSIKRYWTPRVDNPIPASADPHQLASELRHLLDAAVRRRLPPSGGAATHCSGGLDSSAITVLAADALAPEGRDVLGCYVGAGRRDDIETVDASPYVAALSQRHGNLQTVTIERPKAEIAYFAEQRADLPIPADWTSNEWHRTFEEAGRRGIPVLLSGYGGDETASFKGQGAVTGALLRLDLRGLKQLLDEHKKLSGHATWRILGRELADRLLSPTLRSRLRSRLGRVPDNTEALQSFLTSKGRQMTRAGRTPWTSRAYRKRLLTDGRLAINAETSAMFAARFGVSVAYPFLDRDVVAFTLRLPANAFLRDGQARWILREAMDGALPEMIRTRQRKLPDDNTSVLALSEHRADFLRVIDQIEQTDAAEYFRMDRLRAAVEHLPTEEEARRDAMESGDQGEQPDVRPGIFTIAFVLSRFLAGQTGPET